MSPSSWRAAARPAPASTSSPPRCARASSPPSSSWPCVHERALLRAAPREQRFVGGTRLTTFFDVRPGDYVVHEDHGIARFAGIETRTVAGVTRDYLLLEFKGEDRVFVPHDQIGKVSRYIGAGAGAPSLNRLGGTHWQTVKTRARKAVVEMAGELLQLYAARQAIPGLRLLRRTASSRGGSRTPSPSRRPTTRPRPSTTSRTTWRRAHPMDRLVCGDVGYGKTEVAMRAAFKAAEAGKQTLMLVPTTILAEQHYMTFARALRRLPGAGRRWSRASAPPAEQRRILAEFSAGKVDVLIGTHRLLSHRRRAARPGAGRSSTRSSASACARRSCCATSSCRST